jgi:hypothetical protein
MSTVLGSTDLGPAGLAPVISPVGCGFALGVALAVAPGVLFVHIALFACAQEREPLAL